MLLVWDAKWMWHCILKLWSMELGVDNGRVSVAWLWTTNRWYISSPTLHTPHSSRRAQRSIILHTRTFIMRPADTMFNAQYTGHFPNKLFYCQLPIVKYNIKLLIECASINLVNKIGSILCHSLHSMILPDLILWFCTWIPYAAVIIKNPQNEYDICFHIIFVSMLNNWVC